MIRKKIKIFHVGILLFMANAVMAQDRVSRLNQLIFELPPEFEQVEEDSLREMFQNDEGVTFAYDIGNDNISSFSDVETVAAMSIAVISESLNHFDLIHHDKQTYIDDRIFVMMIYSYTSETDSFYSSMLFTEIDDRLITFTFSCPFESAESNISLLEDIMESLEVKKG